MNEHPVFIKLLEYGEKIGLDGSTKSKMWAWASENNILPPEASDDRHKKQLILDNLFHECFQIIHDRIGADVIYNLKAEYYFRLLEYRELSEAREASYRANRNALWAIKISIIALIISLLIGFFQINNSVSLNSEQFTEIVKSIENTKKIDASNPSAP